MISGNIHSGVVYRKKELKTIAGPKKTVIDGTFDYDGNKRRDSHTVHRLISL